MSQNSVPVIKNDDISIQYHTDILKFLNVSIRNGDQFNYMPHK